MGQHPVTQEQRSTGYSARGRSSGHQEGKQSTVLRFLMDGVVVDGVGSGVAVGGRRVC